MCAERSAQGASSSCARTRSKSTASDASSSVRRASARARSVSRRRSTAAASSASARSRRQLIRRRGPWKGLDDVELATFEWVDWHNHRRLHTACHDLPRVEYEQIYYGQHPAQQSTGASTP